MDRHEMGSMFGAMEVRQRWFEHELLWERQHRRMLRLGVAKTAGGGAEGRFMDEVKGGMKREGVREA